MIACQLVAPGAPLGAAQLPAPVPRPGEVVVRVRAAGVCRSDMHYQDRGLPGLPRTLGHEIAGVVEAVGTGVTAVQPGQPVAVHYLVACGDCDGCRRGERFCRSGAMIGKDRDGGFAGLVLVPERNAVPVPDGVPLETAAIMMCSTATAFHALRVGEAAGADRVGILGFGGLGVSALALTRALELPAPVVVEARPEKRRQAEAMGATAVGPEGDALERAAGDAGLDVVLDFVGDPALTSRGLRSLGPRGRLVLVALSREPFDFDPYRDVLVGERRIVGCSDHTREELQELLAMAADGRLDMSAAISRRIDLDAGEINAALAGLRAGTDGFRTVVVPG